MRIRSTLVIALIVLVSAIAHAQYSYPTRRALVADVCPDLKITSFSFDDVYERSSNRFKTSYAWRNQGEKDIIAFEFVVVRFDPFNDSLIGFRSVMPGHNSATYKPLKKGEEDADGSSSFSSSKTYTAFAYIRSIRYSDNTVWRAATEDVIAAIKKQAPDILDPGSVDPPKPGSAGGGSRSRAR